MATALRALVVALAIASTAQAVECAVPVGADPALAKIPAEARLGFLRRELSAAAHKARIWNYTWIAIYAAGTVGELGLTALDSPDARIDSWVAGAAAFLGFGAQIIVPPKVIRDDKWLEARITRLPNADPCAHLADAERILERDADADEKAEGPLLHVGNFLVNIAGGIIIGMVGNRWSSALIQIFVGSIIGEVTNVTHPVDTIDALARYRKGDLAAKTTRLQVFPSLARDQYGLALSLSF